MAMTGPRRGTRTTRRPPTSWRTTDRSSARRDLKKIGIINFKSTQSLQNRNTYAMAAMMGLITSQPTVPTALTASARMLHRILNARVSIQQCNFEAVGTYSQDDAEELGNIEDSEDFAGKVKDDIQR
jgi:hypothetical protein